MTPQRERGAAALGPYTARRIVEARGGSIRAASGSAGGAPFAVELPAPAPTGGAVPDPPGQGQGLAAAEQG